MELGAQLVYLGSARVLARSGQLHVMLTRCLARTLAGSWKPCPLLGSWRRYSLAKKVTRLIRYPVFKELTALYRGISLAVKRCLGRRLANRVMRQYAHVPIARAACRGRRFRNRVVVMRCLQNRSRFAGFIRLATPDRELRSATATKPRH
ncbi:Uncharacterised protein [uncultured Collinsella sp.]|nr:Uncharacterised protein [uncultured Collinsella sp.]